MQNTKLWKSGGQSPDGPWSNLSRMSSDGPCLLHKRSLCVSQLVVGSLRMDPGAIGIEFHNRLLCFSPSMAGSARMAPGAIAFECPRTVRAYCIIDHCVSFHRWWAASGWILGQLESNLKSIIVIQFIDSG